MKIKLICLGILTYFVIAFSGRTNEAPQNSLAQVPWGLTMTNGGRYILTGDSLTDLQRWSDYFVSFMVTRYPTVTQHWRIIAKSGEQLINNYGQSADYMSWFDEYVAPARGSQVFVMMTPNGSGMASNHFYTALQIVATNKIAGYAAGMSYSVGGFSGGTNNRPELRSSTNYAGGIPVLLGTSPLDTANGSLNQQQRSDAHTTLALANGYPYSANLWRSLYHPFSNNYANSGGLGGSNEPINLGWKDSTHPGPAGFLCFAYAILTNLNEGDRNGLISTATIDAATHASVEVTNCTIGNIQSTSHSVSFTRLDTRLPMAWDQGTYPRNESDCSAGALTMFPGILTNLNRYLLYVSNLTAGTYTLSIDGEAVTNLSHLELESGINMAAFRSGTIHTQVMNVLNCVRDLQGIARTNDITGPNAGVFSDSAGPNRYGVTRYISMCAEGWKLGLRDDGLVSYSNVIAAENMMLTNSTNSDLALMAAAQPILRTFSITPSRVEPTITWATPAPIAYGKRLGSEQLCATANLPGTFLYSPAAGYLPTGTGTVTLTVIFSRFDTNNYSSLTGHVTQTVFAAPLNIIALNQTKTFGLTLSFQGTEFMANGLQNGDAIDYVTLSSPGANASATGADSPYPILATNPLGQGFRANNYQITFQPGLLTVNSLAFEAPPIVIGSPIGATVKAGTTLALSVFASGSQPLVYQWYRGSAPLIGAVDSTLSFTNIQVDAIGAYQVVVANQFGSVTSSPAIIEVQWSAPEITCQPVDLAVNAGQAASFTVACSGTSPLTYQWRFYGTNLTGKTLNALSVTKVSTTNVGPYSVLVSNAFGTAIGGPAYLSLNSKPLIVKQPTSTTSNPGSETVFVVCATGTAPLAYQWKHNGNNLAGATDSTLQLTGTSVDAAGSYSVMITNVAGSTLSSLVQLTMNQPPCITLQPISAALFAGGKSNFTVGASGTAPLGFQWMFSGTNIPGATKSTLSISSAQFQNEGMYSATVSNVAGIAFSSNALLTVLSKPGILTQPKSLILGLNSDASFNVKATGNGSFDYQWFFNDSKILGATGDSLSFKLVSASQLGSYSVSISNLAGGVVSSSASLSMGQPPTVTKTLVGRTNLVGTGYTFSTAATGNAPLSYQWRFNGTEIPGATSTAFVISNMVTESAGLYSILVTNSFGSVTSEATLSAALDLTAPTLTLTSPTAAQNLTWNVLLATGTATDNAQVTSVAYSLNGSVWEPATTTNAWKNWSIVLDNRLVAGTNLLAVQATDFSGNISLTASQKFFFAVPSLLRVMTNGSGTLSANLDLQSLLVGRSYTVSAQPLPGWVFRNWLAGTQAIQAPSLTFSMQTNLIITANFLPSPFVPGIAGTYTGLFYETNAVAFPSSGLLSITVDGDGYFTGKLNNFGLALTVTGGLFDCLGHTQILISRASQQLSSLLLELQLDLTGTNQSLTGLVSSTDGTWTAPFWGSPAVFSATSPSPWEGKYTLSIQDNTTSDSSPGGIGYGAITVNSNGAVVLTGYLGDGTKQVQTLSSVSVSPQGLWPLYEPLYAGGGALLGWISITNSPGVSTNLGGKVWWTKSGNPTNTLNPTGFTNILDLVGYGYSTPSAGSKVVGSPISTVILTGGSLATSLTNIVTLNSSNTLIISPNPYSLRISVATASGLFNGSFLNPVTGLTNLINGVFLQDANIGQGTFSELNSTGAVLIQ